MIYTLMIQIPCLSSSYYSARNGYRSKLVNLRSPPKVENISIEREKIYGGIIRVVHENPEKERYALVLGRYSKKWSFPKGHSNEGETPLECTQREIIEETGIHTLPNPIEYLRIGYGNYYLYCLNRPIPLRPKDTYEISDAVWCTISEMESMSINYDVSRYIKGWKKRNRKCENESDKIIK